MLAKVLAAVVVTVAAGAFSAPAHAAGRACATSYAAVNGQVLVDRTDCADLP